MTKMPPSLRYNCPECRATGTAWGGKTCPTCEGRLMVHISSIAIERALKGRGDKPLRSTKPDIRKAPYGATFVWRIARFLGGADPSMPVTCYFDIGCHGIQTDEKKRVEDVLWQIAEVLAERAFGTSSAGCERWLPLLGWNTTPRGHEVAA